MQIFNGHAEVFAWSRRILASVVSALATSAVVAQAHAADRPNVLWITVEDTSPALGCYGDTTARTPALDRFAKESVRYTHAFATAPVCSPARSCLITGLYATSLGTQNLRSQFPIPAALKGFPKYLRDAGYFCSNNVKTDYNLANESAFIREAWDRSARDAHWRQRRPGQPFFSVFNVMFPHQSHASVEPWEVFEKRAQAALSRDERCDPASVMVPPYYPDTPTVRRTLARFYDCVAATDKIVAGILDELEKDGLTDETIVFFFSDHGSGIPRHKRVLYDSGLQVPFMVRFPRKWQHVAPAAPGAATTRLVSFVDFAPSVLSLAGVGIPPHMQGVPFLGPKAGKARTHVFGARDRVDEAFDVARSVRDERWLYIRNYMPHLSWNQPEAYSDKADMRREITALAAAGKLNEAQLTYAGSRRPPEELYDTVNDPFQIYNLARAPMHQRRIIHMRDTLRRWIVQSHDIGFLPEAETTVRCGGRPPFEFASDNVAYPLRRIVAAAERAGDSQAVDRQIEMLVDRDSAVRYWAAVGLRAQTSLTDSARSALRQALRDLSPTVRIEAAGALLSSGDDEGSIDVLAAALDNADWNTVLHSARTLQLLGTKARPAAVAMRKKLAAIQATPRSGYHDTYVRDALSAALKQIAP